jgi:hypothetical protein
MHTIAILSFVALTTTSLALIHETRLRRAARKVLRRSFLALRRKSNNHAPAARTK